MTRGRLLPLATCLVACALCLAASPQAHAQQRKLGVVYLMGDADAAQMEQDLRQIIEEVGGGYVRRQEGERAQRLVIQAEVDWRRVHLAHLTYDWQQIDDFAQVCRHLGVAWTPLLSYHNVPPWVYEAVLLRTGVDPRPMTWEDAQPGGCRNNLSVPCQGEDPTMKLSPSAPGLWWSGNPVGLAHGFNRAFAARYASYYPGTIEEVFVGRETNFREDVLVSYDDGMRDAYRSEFTGELPEVNTREFAFARANAWSNMLIGLINALRSQIPQLPVSTMIVPSDITASGRINTVLLYDNVASQIDRSQRTDEAGATEGFLGLDMYPPEDWRYRRVPAAQVETWFYLSQFNLSPHCVLEEQASHAQVYEWLRSGFEEHNVRAATFYAWNPLVRDGCLEMTPEQARALRDFSDDWIDCQSAGSQCQRPPEEAHQPPGQGLIPDEGDPEPQEDLGAEPMPEEEATASIAPYRYKQTISSCQAGRQAGGLGALSTWGLGWLRRRQGTL